MDIYREQIIDHYKNPRNSGELPDFTHEAELKNLSCGDEIKVQVKIGEQRTESREGISKSFYRLPISDIRFSGRGCAICIAATSLMSEEVKGKRVDEVQKMTIEDIEELLGTELSPSRKKCAHLGLLTLQKALSN